jgi:hypothetical protein
MTEDLRVSEEKRTLDDKSECAIIENFNRIKISLGVLVEKFNTEGVRCAKSNLEKNLDELLSLIPNLPDIRPILGGSNNINSEISCLVKDSNDLSEDEVIKGINSANVKLKHVL